MTRFRSPRRGLAPAAIVLALALLPVGAARPASAATTPRAVDISAWGMGAFSHFIGLRQYAVTAGFPLPDFRLAGAVFHPQWTVTAGHLVRSGDQGSFVSGGARVFYLPGWKVAGLPLFLEGGESPTLMDRRHYGGKDFGSDIEFISHLTAGLRFGPRDAGSVGLRIQHMSNASISSTNPGVNMVGLQASYRFGG
ncbi:MAG TPA: acyloxyacyl hydrolase [Gammaproteobacteria bacterium]|nr:acyloxyacyl hydrolase [Gammaproteobacteria bacterium]